ncbi:capsule biosynthesis GfcC family protein [Rhodanobacter sp. MP7CTX1]|uniref:capsule biosynthesis GfcC family protein n=1 Tax=Rhodanobacter sp. MP7CTX1 TaxID=2723084 RepID=UPI0017930BAB|nr:capsule biosynthesis GfcC family protein [Rhodanobacter sp. MP7CTX1]MBB6186552.1 hypothetical protein [Rhodanobacter sp. MP7CTX1]
MRRLHTHRRMCLFALLAWCASAVAAPVQVELTGVVANAATQTLKDHGRLSDAALAAQPLAQAYILGAAWLRPGLLESQERLKAGVLFDLDSLRQQAGQQGKPDLASLAGAMTDWIKPMPVTGRQPALLDPRAVEVNPPENRLLADGDRLYYPLRPDAIRVVGAVQQPCTLPLVPLQDALRYLAACAATGEADQDIIFVIEPDGHVFEQGIALWNRSTPVTLAPGALIYVPLRARAISQVDPSFNHDLATFLATQLLPGPRAK